MVLFVTLRSIRQGCKRRGGQVTQNSFLNQVYAVFPASDGSR
jgi:hypothetical protein